jgi:hypothetical protein
MDTKKRQKIVYAVAAIAVIWGAYNILGGSDKKAKQKPEPLNTIEEVAAVKKSAESFDVDEYTKLTWGPDPFYRSVNKKSDPVDKPKPTPGWILGGILWNDKNPSAVINKKIVRHGDIVNGAKVVKIYKNLVALQKDSTEFTLTITKD